MHKVCNWSQRKQLSLPNWNELRARATYSDTKEVRTQHLTPFCSPSAPCAFCSASASENGSNIWYHFVRVKPDLSGVLQRKKCENSWRSFIPKSKLFLYIILVLTIKVYSTHMLMQLISVYAKGSFKMWIIRDLKKLQQRKTIYVRLEKCREETQP